MLAPLYHNLQHVSSTSSVILLPPIIHFITSFIILQFIFELLLLHVRILCHTSSKQHPFINIIMFMLFTIVFKACLLYIHHHKSITCVRLYCTIASVKLLPPIIHFMDIIYHIHLCNANQCSYSTFQILLPCI